MKFLIDANVLLDVLQKREPHIQASAAIWKLCETKQVTGYVSALTFANVVYILRKEINPKMVQELIRSLSLIFVFVDLCVFDLSQAADLGWSDYEDAVQSVTAERIHADCIVTRNVKDFANSAVVALTPSEIIRAMI